MFWGRVTDPRVGNSHVRSGGGLGSPGSGLGVPGGGFQGSYESTGKATTETTKTTTTTHMGVIQHEVHPLMRLKEKLFQN